MLREFLIALFCVVFVVACDDADEQPISDTGLTEDSDVLTDSEGSELLDDSLSEVEELEEEVEVVRPVATEVGEVIELESDAGTFELFLETGTDEEYFIIMYSGVWDTNLAYPYVLEENLNENKNKRLGQGDDSLEKNPENTLGVRLPCLAGTPAELLASRHGFVPPIQNPRPLPGPGDLEEFSLLAQSNGTERVERITAEALLMTEDVIFWQDISPGVSPISDEILNEIAIGFSERVLPRSRVLFGTESDVDQNERVSILFTPLFYDGGDGAVAYFYPCDLMGSDTEGCRYSNEQEMLYLTTPDTIGPPMNTPNAILETVAHELNHMIYWNRKYILNNIPDDREDNMYWMEGLAELAQELTGYGAGIFFIGNGGLDNSDQFSVHQLLAPGVLYDSHQRDGMLRGGAYLFAHYLYDQAGGASVSEDGTLIDGGGIAMLHRLFDEPELAEESVSTTNPDRDLQELVFDWFTALALTRRGPEMSVLSDDPRFNYLPVETDPLTNRVRGFDPFGSFHGMERSGPVIIPMSDSDQEILSSGGEILHIAGVDKEEFRLSISADEEADLRVRVVRIR